ncbi:actin-binding LIM protein 2 isoform X12 [Brachyhypopomus gauderio]|uniref:actin-binding LIM protein 2 isoform X12 n=1 Tax=Brachyhypopomus gauderio TaxID=698409 RepID=UPI0040410C70
MPEEKVFQQQSMSGPLEQAKGQTQSGPVLCHHCGKACKGEVLRVQNKHFHIKCFVCRVCGCDLAQGGFFVRQGEYICTLDYQRLYGTRCFSCEQFIEGEVVSALGKTYHPQCFVCAVCKQPFPAGDRVTFNGRECICQKCTQPLPDNSPAPVQAVHNCCGCGKEFQNEQSLVALEKHWHLGCFKCKVCNKVLNAEYISKDGIPYCEMDYHAMYGIQCENCKQYITGKVLEAGEKHYHPTCARCVRCDQMFGEGEEMYLQGSSIWHPPCRQAARLEEKTKKQVRIQLTDLRLNVPEQVTRASSESITSAHASSASGSPSRVFYAKLGDEYLDYKDLAALPKIKAIYNIDRPDMLSYSQCGSYPPEEKTYAESPQLLTPTPTEGDGEKSPHQRRASSPSSNSSLGGYGRYTPSRSPQTYSRPGSESGRSTPSLSAYSDGKSPSSTYVSAPKHFHIPASRGSWQDGDDLDRKTRTSWTNLKSEMDGQSPSVDPRTSTHSLPTDMTQPNFSCNKSASLPGYGRNGIYKGGDLGEDDHESEWGAMRGQILCIYVLLVQSVKFMLCNMLGDCAERGADLHVCVMCVCVLLRLYMFTPHNAS